MARHGRDASIEWITASGAPSLGLGQNTETSNHEHIGDVTARGGQEMSALAERLSAPAKIGFGFSFAGHDEVDSVAGQAHDRIDRHVIALLT